MLLEELLSLLELQIGHFRDVATKGSCEDSNRKIVQNHIGGVHAAAMALLAETATGFVAGMSIPGDRLPLLKSMEVNYVKRAKGNLEAVASLDDEAIAMIVREEKRAKLLYL